MFSISYYFIYKQNKESHREILNTMDTFNYIKILQKKVNPQKKRSLLSF